MYPRRLFSISKTFNIHPQQGKNLFNFRQKRKCFQKMALFIWMEKYLSICVIAWVIVPLPTCWKAYHFYHPVTLVTVINPWNWQDTSCQCREALVIFEGKSHLNGENVTVQRSQIQHQTAQLLCFRDTVSIPVCPYLFFTFHYMP